MKDINDFYTYYETELRHIIDENTAKAMEIKRLEIVLWAVFFCVGLVLSLKMWSFIPVIIPAVAFPFVYYKKINKFVSPKYAYQLINGIIKFIDSDLSYRRHDSIGNYGFKSSGVSFSKIDKYKVYDAISGKYKGVNVNIAFISGLRRSYKIINFGSGSMFSILEIIAIVLCCIFVAIYFIKPDSNAYISQQSGKAITSMIQLIVLGIMFVSFIIRNLFSDNGDAGFTYDSVRSLSEHKNSKLYQNKEVFSGLLFSMDFNKHFNGRTLGENRAFATSFFPFDLASSVEKVELENQDFMDVFSVYSNDQQEARYLLTPLLMEKLLALKLRIKKPVNFSFYRGKLYIAIKQYDFFTMNFDKDGDNFEVIGQFYVYILELLEITAELGIDKHIWTKK